MLHDDVLRQYYDDLLKDVAGKIQISRTAYTEAVSHFDAVAGYMGDEPPEFSGFKPVIYPQGSFRMGSTISAYDDREDYDIDLLLELEIDRHRLPADVLGMVAKVLANGKGRLQFKDLEIKKRCVTLWYENMHLDVTPAVLMPTQTRRTISIFDTHPDRPDHALANPEGFAEWFDYRVRPHITMDTRLIHASTVPVPQQKPPAHKSDRLLAIQLLKRFRDIHCDNGGYDRMPSVLLSKIAAEAPQRTGLVADLQSVAEHMAPIVEGPLDVRNPRCPEDILSDRWPKKEASKQLLGRDLRRLSTKLGDLFREGPQYEKHQTLRDLFGERAATEGFRRAAERSAEKSREGKFVVAAGGMTSTGASHAKPTIAPSQRFFGKP